jgi:3-methyladenine DNA glycosylase AlkD
MPTLMSVMADLKSRGKEQTRKIYARHGMDADRLFGVSTADLKLIAKTIKGQQALACELLSSGNLDAMYLAGMVADGSKVTSKQLNLWLENAAGLQMVAEYTIPWLAVENAQARTLALEWIDSRKEHVAATGWCTYSGLVATSPDGSLDLPEIKKLLDKIAREIHTAPNRVRHTMNNFIIAVGTYVAPLHEHAKTIAGRVGAVRVDMGETACKVPLAAEYIQKAEDSGKVGKKRKTIRC